MIMLFACGNGGAGCDYMLNYINVTVHLTAAGVEYARNSSVAKHVYP